MLCATHKWFDVMLRERKSVQKPSCLDASVRCPKQGRPNRQGHSACPCSHTGFWQESPLPLLGPGVQHGPNMASFRFMAAAGLLPMPSHLRHEFSSGSRTSTVSEVPTRKIPKAGGWQSCHRPARRPSFCKFLAHRLSLGLRRP